MTTAPRDNDAYRFPVSVKAVVLRGDAVVLVKNRRDEWELPGGKLERNEEPAACVTREIEEELRLSIRPDQLLDAWVYTIAPGIDVLVVSYGCTETSMRDAVLSDEHTEFDWIPLGDVETLRMPAGYKSSIRRWAAMVQSAKHQVEAVRRA
jgi:8-oxo-dGTP pyrophosphatase MutT (NUDIX family)